MDDNGGYNNCMLKGSVCLKNSPGLFYFGGNPDGKTPHRWQKTTQIVQTPRKPASMNQGSQGSIHLLTGDNFSKKNQGTCPGDPWRLQAKKTIIDESKEAVERPVTFLASRENSWRFCQLKEMIWK